MSSIKDVSINDEVANHIERGHGVVNIPRDALHGLYKGLKKRFGFNHVKDNALSAGRVSKIKTKANQVSYKSEKVTQVLSQNSSNQTQYLMSIDDRLKEIEQRLSAGNQMALKDKAESKVIKAKQEQIVQKALSPKLRERSGQNPLKGPMKSASDILSIGNILKYGTSVAVTGFDAFHGAGNSKEWGTNKVMGGLIGMLTGDKKGGFLNALSKGTTLATVGGMLKGPIGALIGGIVGVVGGFIGGDKLNGFIKDFIDNKIKAIPSIFHKILHEKKANDDIFNKISVEYRNFRLEEPFLEFFDSAKAMLKSGSKYLIADAESSVAGVLKSIGLNSLGDKFEKFASNTRKDAENVANSSVETAKARRSEVAKKDQDLKDKMEAAAGNTGYVHAAKEVITKEFLTDDKNKTDVASNTTKSENKQSITSQKTEDSSKTTTPQKVKSDVVEPDLTVGDVPGSDIKNAALAASNMRGVNGDIDDIVPPEALATTIRKESGGNIKVKDGDNGTAIGIAQIRPAALKDVNDNFGLNITKDMLRDYSTSLLVSALFLKLKLKEKHGNIKLAFGRYNGSGVQADKYAESQMNAYQSLLQKTPVPVQPKQKETGGKMLVAQKETNHLQDFNSRAGQRPSIQAAPSIAAVNTVNNQNMNLSMPDTRNSDPSYLRTLFG
jgi:hypothetical protein